ncbi:MAG: alkaline phosphatase family protein [Bacteroidetes bacterium]|nr:alkaline phosphatase family protein [Bacteroidota bacterium]
MKRTTFFFPFIFIIATLGCKNTPVTSVKRPKLVVGIVVDQMRWDFLYRYNSRYGKGGFKRLMSEGFSCENAMINYLPAYTAVGHSCIFTGSVPSINGISGNDWIEQLTGKSVYCTQDNTVQGVGVNSAEDGKMSPRNLLSTTITDELRMATNYESKVVGISLKDRAAILPAGHSPNGAFWLDDSTGRFITSSYYMQRLPYWVEDYNRQNHIEKLIANGWNTLYDGNSYTESDADEQPYEGKFAGETTTSFPHNIKEAYKIKKSSFRYTPFGNSFTLDFAKEAVMGYQLGMGASTDFLTINCASTDYVGHMFGPNSREVEDTYLRLDKDLEDFFSFLDDKVGKDNYLVFMTADHGAANAIQYMQKHGMPAEFLNSKQMLDSLNIILKQKFKVDTLVKSGMNSQVNFDMPRINRDRLDFDAIKKTTVDYLQQQPGILYAVDVSKIGVAAIPEPIKKMIINGYNFKRSGAVQVIANPGWFEGYGKTGTTHGAWYPYDTHIPLLFMGWGIRHGSSNATVHMTDIAPTISALLHIQMPNGCIGEPIQGVVNNR